MEEREFASIAINEGNIYLEKGDYLQALRYYKIAIEYQPSFADAYVNIAIVYDKIDQPSIAIKWFRQAVIYNPTDAEAYFGIGLANFKLKNYSEAIEWFKKAINFQSEYPQAYFNIGVSYDNLENFPESIKWYKNAIDQNPNFAEAFHNIGQISKKLGNYDEAIEWYQRSITCNPEIGSSYFSLGFIYSTLKNNAEALSWYLKAFEHKFDDNKLYINIGLTFTKLYNYDEAIKWFQLAIDRDSSCTEAYYNIGLIHLKIMEPSEALKWFKYTLNQWPNFADIYYNIGVAYIDLKNYVEAINWFLLTLNLDSNFASAYHNLGAAYFNLNNFSEAIKWFKLAIDYEPNNALAYFSRGVSYQKINNISKAQADFIRYTFLSKKKNNFVYELLNFFSEHANVPFVSIKLLRTLPVSDIHGYESFINRLDKQCRPIEDFLDYLQMKGFEKNSKEHYVHLNALCQYFMGDMAESERIFDYEIDADSSITKRMMSYYYYLRSQILSALPDSFIETLRTDIIKEAEAVLVTTNNTNLIEIYYAGLIFYQYTEDTEKAYHCFLRAKGLLPSRYMLWLIEKPHNQAVILQEIQEREARLSSEHTFRKGLHPRKIGRDVSAYWASIQQYCFYYEILEALQKIPFDNYVFKPMPFYKYWQFELDKDEQKDLDKFRANRERSRIYNLIEKAIENIKISIDNQKIQKDIESSFTLLMREFNALRNDAETESGEKLERNLALHIYSTGKEKVFEVHNIQGISFLDAHQLIALYFFSLGKINARTTAHLIFYAIYTARIHHPRLLRQVTKEGSIEGISDDLKGSDLFKESATLLVQSISSTLAIAYGTTLCTFFISFTVKAFLMYIQDGLNQRSPSKGGSEDYQLFLNEFGAKLAEVQSSSIYLEGLNQVLKN